MLEIIEGPTDPPFTLLAALVQGISYGALVMGYLLNKDLKLWALVSKAFTMMLYWACKDSDFGAHARGP